MFSVCGASVLCTQLVGLYAEWQVRGADFRDYTEATRSDSVAKGRRTRGVYASPG